MKPRRDLMEWQPSRLPWADQLAGEPRDVEREEKLGRAIRLVESGAEVGRAMLLAERPDEVLRLAVQFAWDHARAPVAGWLQGSRPNRLELTCVRGTGSEKRRELQRSLRHVRPWSGLTRSERSSIRDRFASIVGAPDVTVVDAAPAIVLIGGRDATVEEIVGMIDAPLTTALGMLDVRARIEQKNRVLDVGVAWAAHELRTPLLGVKAALEVLARDGSWANATSVRRSLRDLERAVGETEEILSFAVGMRGLRRRQTDLVRLVNDVVASTALDGHVTVNAPKRALALVDGVQVRTALTNLILNALTYTDARNAVVVTVATSEHHVRISVRDAGPGVAIAERDAIFDPFVRGAASSGRRGAGLGLFIARRVVEEHGGRIWVGGGRRGATFHVELPREWRGLQRHAS